MEKEFLNNNYMTEEEIKKLTDNELNWKLFGQSFQSNMELYSILSKEKSKRIKSGKWTEKD